MILRCSGVDIDRGRTLVTALLVVMLALLSQLASANDAVPRDVEATASEPRWQQALAAERAGFALEREHPVDAVTSFVAAGELFESVARSRSEPEAISVALWRSARCYWYAADVLGEDGGKPRDDFYVRAETLSDEGIATWPRCAECMLWKFSSMGRLATARGIWTQGRQVPVMAELLDRALALEPTYADNENDSTLGNLHHSSAIFYRVLPEWFFMDLFVGVRGDKDRALRHIEAALKLHPARIDYQVELGSQLLCRGESSREGEEFERGVQVLEAVVQSTPTSLDDDRKIAAARIMLEQPDKACGYSGEAWLEMDRDKAEEALEAERKAGSQRD